MSAQSMRRNLLFYVALLAVFGVGIYLILDLGARLQPGEAVSEHRVESAPPGTARQPTQPAAPSHGLAQGFYENLRHPLSVLLLQVIVILAAARLAGALFRAIGQPAVIGEMAAGIVLGPSLLGALSPGAQSFLFPDSSMDFLKLLS